MKKLMLLSLILLIILVAGCTQQQTEQNQPIDLHVFQEKAPNQTNINLELLPYCSNLLASLDDSTFKKIQDAGFYPESFSVYFEGRGSCNLRFTGVITLSKGYTDFIMNRINNVIKPYHSDLNEIDTPDFYELEVKDWGEYFYIDKKKNISTEFGGNTGDIFDDLKKIKEENEDPYKRINSFHGFSDILSTINLKGLLSNNTHNLLEIDFGLSGKIPRATIIYKAEFSLLGRSQNFIDVYVYKNTNSSLDICKDLPDEIVSCTELCEKNKKKEIPCECYYFCDKNTALFFDNSYCKPAAQADISYCTYAPAEQYQYFLNYTINYILE